MHEQAYASANAALGPATLRGELRARGMFWLLLPGGAIAWALFWFFGPFWFIPLALVIATLIAAVVWMQRVSGVYSVHQNGLAISRGWRFLPFIGARLDLYRWSEIAAVYRRQRAYYSVPRGSYIGNADNDLLMTLSRYEIVARDGRRAVLDSRYGDIEEASKRIESETRQRLLPDLLALYDLGEPLPFGPLTLRQGGFTFGAHERDWSGVLSLNVEKGVLEVEYTGAPGGRRWRTRLKVIPNVDLLLAILRERQPNLWIEAHPDHFAERTYYRRRYQTYGSNPA